MVFRRPSLALVAGALFLSPLAADAADYHHVHITSSDATEAVRWYSRHLDCQPLSDRDDSVDCQGVQVTFDSQPSLGSSQRTGIDRLSFSYADLTAKMGEIESVGVGGAGVRLQRFPDGSTLQDQPGLFFDPWGTRIELVEDSDRIGFHSIHLSATDPAATLAWYEEHFGGEAAQLRGQIDGLRFGDIWLFALRHEDGVPAATTGRAIDHIAFELEDVDRDSVQLAQAGVSFTQQPAVPEGGRTGARRGFVAAPDNVSVAVVEAGFAGVARSMDDVVDITTQQRDYTVPRTPWGEPDFQGVWTGDAAHGIPMERPRDLTDTEVLTPEQAAARRERGTLGSIWGYESEWRDTTLGYVKSAPSQQVAMVIDPPDGRIPDFTPEAQARLANRVDTSGVRRLAAGPEDLSPWVRCITRTLIPTPQVYNNGMQIVQGPGYVAVQREMIHETRVIPTEPKPHVGESITSWLGDARGHWDGDTLVVETSNLKRGVNGSTTDAQITERFTRVGPEMLEYEYTVNDPSTWTAPWTARMLMRPAPGTGVIYEFACHEGNYAMEHALTNERYLDKQGR